MEAHKNETEPFKFTGIERVECASDGWNKDEILLRKETRWILPIDAMGCLYSISDEGSKSVHLMVFPRPNLQGFIHSLIFLFAIDNINKNPGILPNITLGYNVYDSCVDVRLAAQRVLYLLSGPGKMIPNYSCSSHGQLAGIIGDRQSSTTISAAQILGLYGYPQISYGATDHSLSDRRLYPHVFRTVQSHHVHNMVITKLLKHFGWTWVGILVSDDDAGENELQVLTKYMREHGICVAFTIILTKKNYDDDEYERISRSLNDPQVRVIIMCGTYSSHFINLMTKYRPFLLDKILVFPPSWAFSEIITDHQLPPLNGSLAVDFLSQLFWGQEKFVKNYRKIPKIFHENYFWTHLDLIAGKKDNDSFVSFKISNNSIMSTLPSLRTYLSSGISPRLYYAVEILAKSLHEMLLYIKDKYPENPITGLIQHSRKLKSYIQRMKSSRDPMRPSYYFTDQGEAVHPYKIMNWIFIDKTTHMDVRMVEVGNYTPWTISGQELYMNPQSITWGYAKEVFLSPPLPENVCKTLNLFPLLGVKVLERIVSRNLFLFQKALDFFFKDFLLDASDDRDLGLFTVVVAMLSSIDCWYMGKDKMSDHSVTDVFCRHSPFLDAIAQAASAFALASVAMVLADDRLVVLECLELWCLNLDASALTEIPLSRCSDPCLPGSRKKAGKSIYTCCYDCVPCSEGEISNITDSENCMKCPSDEWPNEKRDRCLPKVMDFISYQNDTMASVFSCVSIFGCLVTGSLFGIFISYRDTPIVRANNRNLSYLLLVSLLLTFLSVFLFLGRPSDVTCRLRETSFGIFFSVAISSLLAKTVMVCVAFKSTKPGSPWRIWLSVRLPYTIVLLCSSFQVVLCVIWLSISPPFQDLDTQSYLGKIVIQCNTGSDIWFYSVLGYLGFLAAVSFVLAFMVRTLPDTFNEAKYITFSMLLFCSVWIAMISAYLSTTGKSMVAVEIFAVMVSSAGLLGCVFFPKCFIILFKSQMNRKTDLLGKRKE
ncbi:vomeronasal type-2 receptor 26-like [Hyla sarda]|uniref:vomeronasal type-2 receptor 26-like n=1 Tax=Hyla sarda TaxID=327740 RepID=UPI0024C3E27B|nr:vomeronasal type-2 receptor 26-like [Hyla sarda]